MYMLESKDSVIYDLICEEPINYIISFGRSPKDKLINTIIKLISRMVILFNVTTKNLPF